MVNKCSAVRGPHSPSELIHQNPLSDLLELAVKPSAPLKKNPPLRDKKQSNQSNNESVDQSVVGSVRRELLAPLSGVGVRSEPQAEALIPARERLTPLTVASG